MELADKTILITGGGGGIGAAMGRVFCDHGSRVVLADINGERAANAAARLGPNGRGLVLDVTSKESWRALSEELDEIDILCCNAGVGHSSPVEDFDAESSR